MEKGSALFNQEDGMCHLKTKSCLCLLLMLVATVAGWAEQGTSARQLIENLRSQMKELHSIRANYTVEGNYERSERKVRCELSYLRKGDKYNIAEAVQKEARSPEEKRLVYNGVSIKAFQQDEGLQRPKQGQVHHGSQHKNFVNPNDFLRFAGFTLTDPYYDRYCSQFIYKDMGREIVDGHQCTKVLVIMPYEPEHLAYNYYWIEVEGARSRLLKTLCLVDDDPAKKLFEKHYKYDPSDDYPLPREIYYERYDLEESGERKFRFRRSVTVESLEVNGPVDDSEFEFEFPPGTLVMDTVARVDYVAGLPEDIEDERPLEQLAEIPPLKSSINARELWEENERVATLPSGDRPAVASRSSGHLRSVVCWSLLGLALLAALGYVLLLLVKRIRK